MRNIIVIFSFLIIVLTINSSCKKKDNNSQFNTSPKWEKINTGLDSNANVSYLVKSGSNLLITVNYLYFLNQIKNGVYLTDKNNINWIKINNGIPAEYTIVKSIITKGDTIYVGIVTTDYNNAGLFVSTDNGINWTLKNNIAPEIIAVNNNKLYYSPNGNGLYESSDNGDTWIKICAISPITTIAFKGNDIYIGALGFNEHDNLGIYYTSDNGATWTYLVSNLENPFITSLLVSGNNIYAGTTSGVYISTNYGTSWTAINNGFPQYVGIYKMICDGKRIYASTSNGIYYSQINENNWHTLNNGLPNAPNYLLVKSFLFYDKYLVAGTSTEGVWRCQIK